ncbi:Ger(x)C family spore germination protein [Caldisalinibacter kiritimatiensis]|uniref:Spore germination B3, GerAC n=1 Tax=Caldisalinibacter kiritimatiensis TaxID=1304284 RepID=R1AT04_9FIRM|nr:Ger(x)C family spore germination protein [Caldisalinibacter kiritimatiensis]EOC99781.1 Spore germination B3, GerAC [Caldisalinibacter kiritimatiensis]
MYRKITLFMLMTLLVIITGCWDSMLVEDVFIVTGLGIDISEDNSNLITVTAFGPSVIEKAEEPYISFSGEGNNIGKALQHIRNKTYREVAISHTMILLFSEEVARKDIRKYLDLFIRNAEIGSQIAVAITKGRAQDYFTTKIRSNPNTAMFISDLIETEERKVNISEYTLRGIVNKLNERYSSLVLPYIELGKNKDEILLNRISFFKKGRIVGTLDKDYILPLLQLRGSLERGSIDIGSANPKKEIREVISLKLFPKSRKIDVNIEDNNVNIKIFTKSEANIFELEPPEKKIDEKEIENIEKRSEEYLKKNMLELIEKLQKEFKVDGLNLSEYVRVKYPDYYERTDWNEVFPEINIDIKTDIKIKGIGLTK